MTIWNTRSLALVAAALMAGCSTTNYYGDASGNYANDNSGYTVPYDTQYDNQSNQYGQNDQYGQYGDQGAYDADVSFGMFERELRPYGDWSYHPRWGDVWRPRMAFGFKPYFNGYWANTREHGWMWISDDPWGDLTYRYGRWVFDPLDGWLWVPGYVWGPSWVVWRSGAGSIGWFPMPPDEYYGNGPYRGSYANFYGYRDWYGPSFSNDTFFSLWVFVGEDRFADRNYRSYVRPPRDHGRIIVQTNEVTNYVTVNNVIINRSVNVQNIERASNRRVETVEARTVMRGRAAVVRPVSAGRQVEQRERRERPIPANIRRDDIRGARENARDAREDLRDRREDVRDRREDVRDVRENARDVRENARDARENARDAREDVRDRREDVRDVRENARDRREDVRDARDPRVFGPPTARGPRNQQNAVQGPQNANVPPQNVNVPPQNANVPQSVQPQAVQGPQNGNERPDPRDLRQERLERVFGNRGRPQPQNANVAPQNVNVPPPQNVNVPPQNRDMERAVERPVRDRPDNNGRGAVVGRGAERAAILAGNPPPSVENSQPNVQPAAVPPSEAAPTPNNSGNSSGNAAREQRQQERNARREEAAERRNNR